MFQGDLNNRKFGDLWVSGFSEGQGHDALFLVQRLKISSETETHMFLQHFQGLIPELPGTHFTRPCPQVLTTEL